MKKEKSALTNWLIDNTSYYPDENSKDTFHYGYYVVIENSGEGGEIKLMPITSKEASLLGAALTTVSKIITESPKHGSRKHWTYLEDLGFVGYTDIHVIHFVSYDTIVEIGHSPSFN